MGSILYPTEFMVMSMKKIQVEYYDVFSGNLPSIFSGYKIAFLTDLHNTLYGKNNYLLLQTIVRQKPDCIMITGDMIVGTKQFDATVSLSLLEELGKRYPVFYSMGNHEKRISLYTETRHTSYRKYIQTIKTLGIHYLKNHSIRIQRKDQSICITGLDLDLDYYAKLKKNKELKLSYLEALLGKKEDHYTILLAHNPKYFKQYVNWGADLVLSGHIHGGIVILPFLGGVIAPSYELFPKYDSGQFHYKKGQMVLSRGLGVHTIKVRVWNKPELSIITLRKKRTDIK